MMFSLLCQSFFQCARGKRWVMQQTSQQRLNSSTVMPVIQSVQVSGTTQAGGDLKLSCYERIRLTTEVVQLHIQ